MSLSRLNSIGQSVFELESGNENVDGQTDIGHINLIGGLVTRNPPKNNQNSRVYTIHLNSQICVQILYRILIFKGLHNKFKITTTAQYITQIKDSINKLKSGSQ